MTTATHRRAPHRVRIHGPEGVHRRLVSLIGAAALVLGLAALASAVVAQPAEAAPGTLLKLNIWLPRGDFEKYSDMDLVRGPGGDLWLGVTGSTLSTTSPYQKRICVARYSATGARRWGKLVTTALDMERLEGMAVDARRNTVLVGSGHWDAKDRALWEITKLSPKGKRLWRRLLAPPAYTSVPGGSRAVACDSASNIYVVGTMGRASTGTDVALVKYSPAGVRKWTRYLNGATPDSPDAGMDVAVDGAGRVYVTGTMGGFFSGTNILIARFSTAGKQIWRRDWDRTGTDDSAVDLAVSAAGVAVAGTSADASGDDRGVALHATPTMSQNAAVVQYVTTVATKDVEWNSVATNASGSIVVGGSVGIGNGVPAYFAYARYRPGAPADFAQHTGLMGWAECSDVWLGADSTVLGAGTWEVAAGQNSVVLQSDSVAAPDWRALAVAEASLDRGHAVAAGSTRAYVAGEAGDYVGLWVFER